MWYLLFLYNMIAGTFGIVFAFYALSIGFRNRAIQFLSFLLVVTGYTIVYQAIKIHPSIVFPTALVGTDDPLPLLFGPLFYLFVGSIASDRKQPPRVILLHMLPFTAYTAFLLLRAMTVPGSEYPGEPGVLRSLTTLAKLLSGLIYLSLSLGVLKAYNQRIRQTYSSVTGIDLTWFAAVVYVQVGLWVLVIALYLVAGSGLDILPIIDPVTYTVATIGVFALAAFWWRQKGVFLANSVALPEPVALFAEEETERQKYRKSGLTSADLEKGYDRLAQAMEQEKLFLDNDLTLKRLAEKISFSTHHLSQIINERFGKNFYDYINELRVEEVKRQLQNPEKENLTILAIALECGFSSKSTFNTCFKKITGQTPSQYKSSPLCGIASKQ